MENSRERGVRGRELTLGEKRSGARVEAAPPWRDRRHRSEESTLVAAQLLLRFGARRARC
ncbi:Uncharacterized protein M6B38_112910 [Iris pallida]|uniref:Uncharacterized protein n=1 Tax=Iris pallida TaxID=29817 RepID=A0AAX6DN87_IRIPA|nr:Uncharacterized protein M6B38_112910 [Iris pallida]